MYCILLEEDKIKDMNIEVKRIRSGDGNFSNALSDGQGRTKFKQSFPIKNPLVLR